MVNFQRIIRRYLLVVNYECWALATNLFVLRIAQYQINTHRAPFLFLLVSYAELLVVIRSRRHTVDETRLNCIHELDTILITLTLCVSFLMIIIDVTKICQHTMLEIINWKDSSESI